MRRTALVLGLMLVGCTSSRYVGSIGRDRAFVNRGYGFLVRLSHASLSDRFDALVPDNSDRYPKAIRPVIVDTPIDMDADGFLDVTEATRHFVPALRLISRTSTSVMIDIDVQIIANKDASTSLESIALGDLKKLTRSSTISFDVAAKQMSPQKVGPDFDAYVFETTNHRVTVIDQPGFRGEEGLLRRQLVRVTSRGPRIDADLRQEHENVVAALILNRRGSIESTREQW